jgi:hypothetical protein
MDVLYQRINTRVYAINTTKGAQVNACLDAVVLPVSFDKIDSFNMSCFTDEASFGIDIKKRNATRAFWGLKDNIKS